MLKYPEEYAMALGGVPTGRQKANPAGMVTAKVRISGDNPD
jgi:hypothetical protein